MDENYQALANAIVALAAKDYMEALKVLKKNPENKSALAEKNSVEKFFRSDLYSLYTSLDPEYLINRLKEEVG